MLDNRLRSKKDKNLKRLLFLGIFSFSSLLLNKIGTYGTIYHNNKSITINLSYDNWEIDDSGNVNYVVDGDTFDVENVGRIRLADIDAPEQNNEGYQESKGYVMSLVLNHEVYLDIDDIFRTDVYGRLVAVVYLRYNSTFLININKALLNSNNAQIMDYYNEFDPLNWLLYVYYTGSSYDDLFSISGFNLYSILLITSLCIIVFHIYITKKKII
ncbi:MAG: thermonuclease family protein [Candidatus Lokiarchaeota archaeon]|nr:thermonuclease family protein [Candidatus Lokiarchaeota archaeon]